MNKNLIRIKNDLSSFKKTYFWCLILVSLFGVYKNVFSLFNNEISLFAVLNKILFIVLGLGVGLLYDSFKEKRLTFNFNAIIGLIIGMIIPFRTNLFLFLLGLLLMILIDIIDKNNHLNKICVAKLFIIMLLVIFGEYTYLNPLEFSNEYAYTLADSFVGNQIGGTFSTSVLLIFVSFIILSLNKIYKTKIVLISLISYLCTLSLLLLTKDYMKIFTIMQNSSNIFAFVFIAPFSLYSPYKFKEVLFYSLLIGIGSALLSYFVILHEGAIIAILLANIFLIIYNKIHKTTKNPEIS
ncbi:MAG: RnfABCDGE type electron transport complex subunit D [Bacilli bacterium]|nr:RnfABCDGE type electron transport complex subunit D [Bacilli bacterium]